MKEIEVKILNIGPVKIKKILKKKGAKFLKKVKQVNTTYVSKDSLKKKIVVRIRKEGNKNIFTVKGKPSFRGGMKTRTEYETIVKDSKTFEMALGIMGFKKDNSHELIREYYKLGGCLVEIIKFPGIPYFIEIEGNKKQIEMVANILGYSKSDFNSRSIFEIYKLRQKEYRFK